MTTFLTLFAVVSFFIAVPLGILASINALRKKQPGCSGSHDCVVYKGEKVMCPSCELKELKAEIAAAQQQA
ncbi:hypothetical protein [Pontiella agarivorans]|uniref:(Na+)-NQR maturation NqrM n=1 Tax=Pontiella agarivorans TaxID=3038953 RepID=A0ABU5MUP8_9BACT|nr:hypothetical protein [Pontiella agarivorans]MDZ8117885.1 hypothetical protein [Pontiella agarivorans]